MISLKMPMVWRKCLMTPIIQNECFRCRSFCIEKVPAFQDIPKVAFVSLTYMCLLFCFVNPFNDQMVRMKTEANRREGLKTCKAGTNC